MFITLCWWYSSVAEVSLLTRFLCLLFTLRFCMQVWLCVLWRIVITCYDYDKSVINALSINNNSSDTVLFLSPLYSYIQFFFAIDLCTFNNDRIIIDAKIYHSSIHKCRLRLLYFYKWLLCVRRMQYHTIYGKYCILIAILVSNTNNMPVKNHSNVVRRLQRRDTYKSKLR